MYKQLTSELRYTISILLQNGKLKKVIAKEIGVHPFTISRELKRNSGTHSKYNWQTAQKNATYHRHRAPGNRSISKALLDESIGLLVQYQWSPEQISGRLRNQSKPISHETIYAFIRKDKSSGGVLHKNCRHALKHRHRTICGQCAAIPNRISINERPIEANGKRFGDFEMDTIVGKNNKGAIVTIIERNTNMLFMRKLNKGKITKELAKTVIQLLKPYKDCIKTITTDNGKEFAYHEMIAKALDTKIYFADPYSSWQKGGIKNANGLIRQYIPKKSTFEEVTHQKVILYMRKINTRPRKKLKYLTPQECFMENLN